MGNPDAEAALWASHNSVTRYAVRLYEWLKPRIVKELWQALSKIHISYTTTLCAAKPHDLFRASSDLRCPMLLASVRKSTHNYVVSTHAYMAQLEK